MGGGKTKHDIKVKQMMDSLPKGLIDDRWLERHCLDHTQEEIDALTIEVKTGDSTVTLTAKMPQKSIKEVLRNR